MEWLNTLLTVLAGFALRVAIPIIVTALAAHFLRKLDAYWQAEYEQQHQTPKVSKPECWKIKGCHPEQREICLASLSLKPCWQVFRRPDGRLKEECLKCEVFLRSPMQPNA